ncbi:MAG TPA: hypothetical protein VFP72_10950 [Kineosporiaceae bacterium]|nr:hypothetical protein [Kineosporiaceae bacterium]
MQIIRWGRRAGAVAGALVAGLALTGCQGSSSPGKAGPVTSSARGGGAGSATPPGSAATPGGQATAYPAPASASPQPLPSLGSRTNGRWTVVLNGVRKSGANSAVVTATISNVSGENQIFRDFEEPGYAVRTAGGKWDFTYEFSAVTLTVPGSPTLYLAMRDGAGVCACTRGVMGLDKGMSRGVYTYVTLPPVATTVTVTIAGYPPFTDVPVQS